MTLDRRAQQLNPHFVKQLAQTGQWAEVLRLALTLQRLVKNRDNVLRRRRRELTQVQRQLRRALYNPAAGALASEAPPEC